MSEEERNMYIGTINYILYYIYRIKCHHFNIKICINKEKKRKRKKMKEQNKEYEYNYSEENQTIGDDDGDKHYEYYSEQNQKSHYIPKFTVPQGMFTVRHQICKFDKKINAIININF